MEASQAYGKLEGLMCGTEEKSGTAIRLPVDSLTRHGLVCGTTGAGKSRAVQRMMEQLSETGIPAFLSDAKGDVTGFSEGQKAYPTTYWSASDLLVPTRFSLQTVDPALLARFFELNSVQEGHLVLAFSKAQKSKTPLHDLEDLRYFLTRMVAEKEPGVSQGAANVVVRKIAEMEAKGLGTIFGKPELELKDVLSEGKINVLYLGDLRKKGSLASVVPVFFLYRLYTELPQKPDLKTVVFLDEAHLLFSGANKSLVDLIERMLRQIRSQGVSVFFITQDPSDIPPKILNLLGTKVLFANRVFTKKAESAVRALVGGMPENRMLDVPKEIIGLGTGESIVSFLDEQGRSLPPLKIKWDLPESSMDALAESVLAQKAEKSGLKRKYQRKESRTVFQTPTARNQKEKSIPSRIVSRTGSFLLWLASGSWRLFWKSVVPALMKTARWVLKKPRRVAWLLVLSALVWAGLTLGPTIFTYFKTLTS